MTGRITAYRLPPNEHACPYLPARTACYEHYQILELDDQAFCALLELGFRHFGSYYFRPACAGAAGASWCGACVPLRIPVDTFRPSRSQRRVLRKARDAAVQVQIGLPEYSDEKFAMYRSHKQRFRRTTELLDLPEDVAGGAQDTESFRFAFYEESTYTRECTYHVDGELIGVGLLDIASRAMSSIYFFFDPRFESLAPGTLSILTEIGLARERGIGHYYLGYVVHDNPSMRYKAEFRPSQVFDGARWRPHRGADGTWVQDPASFRTDPTTPLSP